MYMFFKKTTYKLANLHVKRICGNYTNWRSFAEGFTSRLLERSRIFYENIMPENNDVQDICESESEEDDDFEYFDMDQTDNKCKDIIVSDTQNDVQLFKYLKDVRLKIEEYIKTNIDNVKVEQVKTSTKVLSSSYESGRKQADRSQKL